MHRSRIYAFGVATRFLPSPSQNPPAASTLPQRQWHSKPHSPAGTCIVVGFKKKSTGSSTSFNAYTTVCFSGSSIILSYICFSLSIATQDCLPYFFSKNRLSLRVMIDRVFYTVAVTDARSTWSSLTNSWEQIFNSLKVNTLRFDWWIAVTGLKSWNVFLNPTETSVLVWNTRYLEIGSINQFHRTCTNILLRYCAQAKQY